MTTLTKNILDFYKNNNDKNFWYLEKSFLNNETFGFFSPYQKNVFCKEWDNVSRNIGTIDPDNEYENNRYGCRGEIYENSTTLASGCSITYGIGVPEIGRWTNILGNKINKNIINLGSPGWSAENICLNIIKYCLNVKMPKEIFCLFPDFFRSIVVADKEFYEPKLKKGTIGDSDLLELIYCGPEVYSYKGSIFMKIEDKKYIEDSISPHQLILDSINYIYILESFCSMNNIKLYWTTWDLSSSLIMQELTKFENFKLKKFTSLFPPNNEKNIGNLINEICQLNHESEFKDSKFWKIGSDYAIVNYKKEKNYAHPGIHHHYHISDLFYDLYNKDLTIT